MLGSQITIVVQATELPIVFCLKRSRRTQHFALLVDDGHDLRDHLVEVLLAAGGDGLEALPLGGVRDVVVVVAAAFSRRLGVAAQRRRRRHRYFRRAQLRQVGGGSL